MAHVVSFANVCSIMLARCTTSIPYDLSLMAPTLLIKSEHFESRLQMLLKELKSAKPLNTIIAPPKN